MKLPVLIAIIVSIILLILFTGSYLSMYIFDTTEYVFFWIMYILSSLTVINIGAGVYYYSVMKKKTGPRGPRGPQGEAGDEGETGRCSVECRNNMCQITIFNHIIKVLNKLENQITGDNTELTVETDLRNPYIKEKVKSMCHSEEYQQIAPIKGKEALLDYMCMIWGDMVKLMYESGGLNYFRTVGAEYDWDWLDDNPWDEFKKYDIYYWGMGAEYRPQFKEYKISRRDAAKSNKDDETEFPSMKNRFAGDNEMVEPGTELETTTEIKDAKYSIFSFINIPSTGVKNDIITLYNIVNDKPLIVRALSSFETPEELLAKHVSGIELAKYLSPLSVLITVSKNSNTISNKCLMVNPDDKQITTGVCSGFEPGFVFKMVFSNKSNKEIRLKHIDSGLSLFVMGSSYKLVESSKASVFKF